MAGSYYIKLLYKMPHPVIHTTVTLNVGSPYFLTVHVLKFEKNPFYGLLLKLKVAG